MPDGIRASGNATIEVKDCIFVNGGVLGPPHPKWAVGDVLRFARPNGDGEPVDRQIVEVRPTGYTWSYPDVPEEHFLSEDSSDPAMMWGWAKVRDVE